MKIKRTIVNIPAVTSSTVAAITVRGNNVRDSQTRATSQVSHL